MFSEAVTTQRETVNRSHRLLQLLGSATRERSKSARHLFFARVRRVRPICQFVSLLRPAPPARLVIKDAPVVDIREGSCLHVCVWCVRSWASVCVCAFEYVYRKRGRGGKPLLDSSEWREAASRKHSAVNHSATPRHVRYRLNCASSARARRVVRTRRRRSFQQAGKQAQRLCHALRRGGAGVHLRKCALPALAENKKGPITNPCGTDK